MQVTWFLNQNYSALEKKLAFSFGTLLKELGFVCLLVGLLELSTVVMSEGGGDRTHCAPTV